MMTRYPPSRRISVPLPDRSDVPAATFSVRGHRRRQLEVADGTSEDPVVMRKPLIICCDARSRPCIEPRHCMTAFTLVLILVVVALIAVLIAILLPVLGKVRESANQVKCMSNLRQLAAAFIMYANNNRGSFPGAADGDWGFSRTPRPTDWIYWQSTRDVNQSAIAPYLGARGDSLRAVLRCPSDDPPPRQVPSGYPDPYNYSYQMNYLLDGNPFEGPMAFYVPPRMQQVRHPSDKILLGETYVRWLDMGSWYIGTVSVAHGTESWLPAVPLSIRHDPSARGLPDPPFGEIPSHLANPDRRGNVAFCDGHAEFVSRAFAATREHADPRY